MIKGSAVAALVSLGIVACSATAGAQEAGAAAPPGSAVPSAAPDVVMLKDGGMLRGTIAELVAKQHVVIVLLTGEKRTIAMDQVRYAGPVERAPADRGSADVEPTRPPPGYGAPAPTLPAPPVPPVGGGNVQFSADEPDITFHFRTGSASGPVWTGAGMGVLTITSYERLCTAPCETTLAPGTYAMGLSKEDGQPVAADGPVRVEGPTRIEGSYESYAGMRTAGWIVFAGSLIGGTALVLTSFNNDCDPSDPSCESISMTRLVGGMVLTTVGGLVGILLAMKSDEAEVRVAPMAMTRDSLRADRKAVAAERTQGVVPGVTASARF